MKRIRWNDISKYRNEIFGLAIISIMVLHYLEYVPQAEYIHLASFKNAARVYCSVIGSVGVDIFLFLSGFGISYSLTKKPDILNFYGKRFIRVLVPYLVLGGIYWIIKDFIILHENVLTFFYDYTLISFWIDGNRTFWYISLIWILYLLSPFVYSTGKTGMITVSILSIIMSIGIYLFFSKVFYNIEIAILRVPVYFIGMLCSLFANDGKTVNPYWWIGGVLAVILKGIAGYFDFPFARLINMPYAITLILLYIHLRKIMREKNNIIQRFLISTGQYSLEFYIIHVALRSIVETLGIPVAMPLVYSICIIITILTALGYAKIHKHLFARIN